MKTIRDPVHNIIEFDKDEDKFLLDLIDTKEFQRLRHIKQLGLSSFTYPGAEHTRFAHSLGVAHLTRRFIQKLSSLKGSHYKSYIEELNDYRKLALASALLHDIGHGPFSHALEKTTGIRHEKWTIEIITGNTEVREILEKHGLSPRAVADVINRTHSSKAVVKLLSSQLDTDRIDYLLRDSKMTGAGYGAFDLEWLINVLTIGEVNGEVEVGLDRGKGKSIAEDFVMARYYMYENVYFHKTTRSAELLIDRILARAEELFKQGKVDLPHDLSEILTKKGQLNGTLDHYVGLIDSTIWYHIYLWQNHSDKILSDLSSRLVRRKLFKEIPLGISDPFEIYMKATEISKKVDLPLSYYFLRDEVKSSSYKDSYILHKPNGEEKEAEREASEQIFLFDKSGEGVELSNISDIIKLIRNKSISIERFFGSEEFKDMFVGGV